MGGGLALLSVAFGAPVAAAQAQPGQYTGTVTNPFGAELPEFRGTVELSVASDGTAVTGRIFMLVDTTLEVEGQENPVCFSIDASFLAAPLAISQGQSSGDIQAVQDLTDGSCAVRTPNQPTEGTGPIEIQFSGDRATGQFTFDAFEAGLVVFPFTATRVGTGGGGDEGGGGGDEGGDDDQASSTSTTLGLPGIDELVEGAALTPATISRLIEIQQCQQRNRDDECVLAIDFGTVARFLSEAQRRAPFSAAGASAVSAAATLSTLTDPTGRLIVPGLSRMLPVIIQMHRQGERSGDTQASNLAIRRLLGLLITSALQARE